MIDNDYTFGTTTISCDAQGCTQSQDFDGFDGKPDFMGAIKEAKEYGWITRKRIDWEHYCSQECLNKSK